MRVREESTGKHTCTHADKSDQSAPKKPRFVMPRPALLPAPQDGLEPLERGVATHRKAGQFSIVSIAREMWATSGLLSVQEYVQLAGQMMRQNSPWPP